MGPAADTTLEWCDHLLASLQDRVGDAGLLAAGRDHALGVSVDQHQHQVRAWLTARGLAVSRQSIAGYAAVLLAAAQRCGRRLPADPQRFDWSGAEWYLVRLLALLAMAAEA
jgi:hypothetical protein